MTNNKNIPDNCFRVIHFNTPKTAKEALEWLKENHNHFYGIRGCIETNMGCLSHCRPYCTESLAYLNGTDWSGRKIRKGSRRDKERIAYAESLVEYYVIREVDYGRTVEVSFDFYSASAYAKWEAVWKPIAVSYEMFAA